MRILMIVMLSLSLGMVLTLFPVGGLWLFATVLLILGTVFFLFFRKTELRLTLILLSLGIGIFLGLIYDRQVAAPALQYSETTQLVTGEATSYSTPTAYGISVEAKLFFPDTTASATVYLSTDEPLVPGDRFTGQIRLVDSNGDGSFYSYSEGIFLLGYGKKDISIEFCDKIPVKYLPKRIAHILETSLEKAFPADTLGFAMALTTGNRSGLSDLAKANLKASGIYHALALSGMHLSILMGITGFLALRHRRMRALLGIPVTILFTIITGCSASMVRAAVMQILLLSAGLFHRERDIPTSLALALGILMAENPWCILNWGLQLSFLSVIGITLFSSRLYRFFMGKKKKGHFRKAKRFVASSLSVTFSAMVMTMPCMAVYFGYISLVSPLTNLLTSTVISFCFGGSLITALMGLIYMPVARILGWGIAWGFRYIQLISGILSKIPFGLLHTRSFYSLIWLVLLYFMIALLAKRNTRKIIPLCCVIASYSICTLFTLLEGLSPAVTALDVGQGQCILMESGGGTTIMVDCGGNRGNAGDVAAEYLSSIGENKIDLLIITHYDDDHVGGIPELLGRVQVDAIALPDIAHETRYLLSQQAQEQGISLYFVETDLRVSFGSGNLTIYSPLSNGDSNETGLSVLASLGSMTLLVTGDMDADTERRLIAEKDLPDIDVLVAGHHGSKYSTSEELLEATCPERVIISVGDNSYGHPAAEILARIAAFEAEILRTDLSGSVTIRGD